MNTTTATTATTATATVTTTTTTTPCAMHDGITLPSGRVLGFDGEEFINGVQFSQPSAASPCAAWRVKASVWRTTKGKFTHRFRGNPAEAAYIECDPAAALTETEAEANAAAAAAFLAERRKAIKEQFLATVRSPAPWAPEWLRA